MLDVRAPSAKRLARVSFKLFMHTFAYRGKTSDSLPIRFVELFGLSVTIDPDLTEPYKIVEY